jgi:hypothetical protein
VVFRNRAVNIEVFEFGALINQLNGIEGILHVVDLCSFEPFERILNACFDRFGGGRWAGPFERDI